MRYALNVNDRAITVEAQPDTPMLWILREHLQLDGPKFGCGLAQCGACMVLIDGERNFSCQVRVEHAVGRKVETVEGLSAPVAQAVKQAWLDLEVPQCGYCQSGQIVSAVDLLTHTPSPSLEEIKGHMSTNLCRCGTYRRITQAIQRAAASQVTSQSDT